MRKSPSISVGQSGTPKKPRSRNSSSLSRLSLDKKHWNKENNFFKFEDGIQKQLSTKFIPLIRQESSSVIMSEKYNCVVQSSYGKNHSLNLKLTGRVQVWQVFDFVTSYLGIPITMKSLFSLYRADEPLRLNELLKTREGVILLVLKQV